MNLKAWFDKLLDFLWQTVRGNKGLIVIFILALAVRFAFLWIMVGQVGADHIFDRAYDTGGYLALADGFLHWEIQNEDAVATFGPGYGAFLAVIFFIFGRSGMAVVVVQIIISAVSCILIYLLAVELFRKKLIAYIAALYFTFSFTSISLANIVLSETAFFLFFVLGNLLFIRGLVQKKIVMLIISGVCIGLSIWIRGIAQFWPWVMLLLTPALPYFAERSKSWKEQLGLFRFSWVAPLIALVFLWGWMARNYHHHDVWYFTTASAGGPANVAAFALEEATGTPYGEGRQAWDDAYREDHGLQQNNLADDYITYRAFAKNVFKKYPLKYLKHHWLLMWENINAYNQLFYSQNPEYKWNIVDFVEKLKKYHWPYYAIYGAIIGLGAMLLMGHRRQALFLLVVLTYFGVLIGVTHWQGSRLFFPADMAKAPIFGFWGYLIWSGIKKSQELWRMGISSGSISDSGADEG